jgi:hypothetical protein
VAERFAMTRSRHAATKRLAERTPVARRFGPGLYRNSSHASTA